jgi:hypothetical protein
MLEFGDPDNAGRDLAGHNEILFRTEIVYGWYVFEDHFSVIETTAATVTPDPVVEKTSTAKAAK